MAPGSHHLPSDLDLKAVLNIVIIISEKHRTSTSLVTQLTMSHFANNMNYSCLLGHPLHGLHHNLLLR